MLQPRRMVSCAVAVLFLVFGAESTLGENIRVSPRQRRQNGEDVTTVLLVDNQGRNSFGRFLNVKPDLGLLTSTARTFIQEGVTTQYATQVLGTTLDNGRLYAHLLTKSSRVLYDDSPIRTFDNPKKWKINTNPTQSGVTYVKNTDYVSPNQIEPFVVFPTVVTASKSSPRVFKNNGNLEENEELNGSSSSNLRIPYNNDNHREAKFIALTSNKQKKAYRHDPKTIRIEAITLKESSENDIVKEEIGPSKIREWDNLPTFTVRNEFSPSGFSYLGGDFPDFEVNTEKSKTTTTAERKAKLLFRPRESEKHDLKTVTYTGFADFTTTVGDTVIIFSPSTAEVKDQTGLVTKIKGEATLSPTATLPATQHQKTIRPSTIHEKVYTPSITLEITTEKQKEDEQEEEKQEEDGQEHDKEDDDTQVDDKQEQTEEEEEEDPESAEKGDEGQKTKFSMVLDSSDRPLKQSEENDQVDLGAKLSILAKEQGGTTESLEEVETTTHSEENLIIYNSDVIEPSESQRPMLSTPSHEDIAKILASLNAKPTQKKSSSSLLSEETKVSTSSEAKESTVSSETTSTAPQIKSSESTKDDQKLSIPSHEDIARILASLNYKSSETAKATEPLNTKSTIFFNEDPLKSLNTEETKVLSGAKTIFFDDVFPTSLEETLTTTPAEESFTQQSPNVSSEESVRNTEQSETTTESTTLNEIINSDEHTTLHLIDEPETERIETEAPTTERQIEEDKCIDDTKILPTTSYHHFNVLTTFFIKEGDTTSTSIQSGISVSTEIGFQTILCNEEGIIPTNILTVQPTLGFEETTTVKDPKEDEATIRIEGSSEDLTTIQNVRETTPISTTPEEITTETFEETTELTTTEDGTTESGEEIELVVKTLYTTFNYLTTYYFGNSSTVSTSKTIETNMITSTLYPGKEIQPSQMLEDDLETPKVTFDDFDLKDDIDDEDQEDEEETKQSFEATPSLSPFKVRTYFTTYTYFSTIFDGEDDSSVLSRTEVRSSVYTDYGTPIEATKTIGISPTDILEGLLYNNDNDEKHKNIKDKFNNYNGYNTTMSRSKAALKSDIPLVNQDDDDNDENNVILPSTQQKTQNYVTLHRAPILEASENSIPDLSDYEVITNMVTNVKSTSSKGDTKVIENVDKRNVLEDQVFSESNNESEVVPSPTLLLQTSYTTFTYFTTTYHGTTSSDINSSLNTITNIVTETLNVPPHTLRPEDGDQPITYFTTFTYWTTSVKKNTTIINSSEKTITEIEAPTPVMTAKPTDILLNGDIQPTPILKTIYSTFTYYTTSYINDNSSTIFSSLATQSKVITKIPEVKQGRAIDLGATQNQISPQEETRESKIGKLSTTTRIEENDGTSTLFSTDIYGTIINDRYVQVEESTSSVLTVESSIEESPIEVSPTTTPEIILKPTGVLSINKGMIVDADGVSTLFYTTQALGTYIDSSYAQIIDSTSFLRIDEEKKALLPTDLPSRRTGLVRFIEGAIIQNETTTLYHSNVLGTIINGSYAQVIESTSSFLVGKKPEATPTVSGIEPTSTLGPEQQITKEASLNPSPVALEGSEATKNDDDNTTEEEEDAKNTKKFPNVRKNNYTPAIRPFSSRASRPAFAPNSKRKGATTITRSDITTPTVTVVPASKQRFGGRKSSSNTLILPTASGSRRFTRPKATSSPGFRRSSSRVQPSSSTGFAGSRRGNFRSTASIRPSSIFNLNRSRIRPTPIGFNRFASSVTPSDEENDITTDVTENPTGFTDDLNEEYPTTTEGRRNPLLNRYRRPNGRTTPKPSTKATKNGKNVKTTTPRPKPTTRPLPGLQNRPRPVNALFPRRGLFTTTTTNAPQAEEEEDYDEDIEDLEGEPEEGEYSDSDIESPAESLQNTRIGRSNARIDKNVNRVVIKPFVRKRLKRQVQHSRFRRPMPRTTTPKEEPTTETTTKASHRKNRFSQRRKDTTPAPKRISPTKASSQGRSQFTLRDSNGGSKSNRNSNFKRPSTSVNARKSSNVSRPSPSKFRNTSQEVRKPNNIRSRPSTVSSRSRTRRPSYSSVEQIDSNFVLPSFDGTITVTHQIPTEVTIPVVNGKITEYKNIVTAKYSTQVLGPDEYTTNVNAFGKDVTVLLSENTDVNNNNGATQVTQFVLNETPTTSIIFTPTYIRGRKTSFSHVIPSTVYGVEEVVNTIQPALAAQAPLANILLSQLLLGNVGFPQQNPLLGFPQPGVPSTPTTEFKTRTTTYVTTVTKTTSTVLPLTFRGKEILTTIVDSSTEVITATEFLTDTVVVTPTAPFPAAGTNQLNSLLVPLLLQQQQQQVANPLLQQPAGVFSREQLQNPQVLQLGSIISNNAVNDVGIDDNTAPDDGSIKETVEQTTLPQKTRKRKPKKQKAIATPTPPQKETSVVTLYVSGRQPGEFTTVLSTYVVGEENNQRKKRETIYIPLEPSRIVNDSRTLNLETYFLMPTDADSLHQAELNSKPTETLESILGDVNKHITSSSPVSKPTKSKKYQATRSVDLCFDSAPLRRGPYDTGGKTQSNDNDRIRRDVNNNDIVNGNSNNSSYSSNFDHNYSDNVNNGTDKFDDNGVVKNEGEGEKTNAMNAKRRRVVKKLVSVRLRGAKENSTSNVPKAPKKRRKVIRIKKRRRPTSRVSAAGNEEHLKKRRKVVITRKRLLHKTTVSPTASSSSNIFSSTESVLVDSLEISEIPPVLTETEPPDSEIEPSKILPQEENINVFQELSKEEDEEDPDYPNTNIEESEFEDDTYENQDDPTRLDISINDDSLYDDNIYDSLDRVKELKDASEELEDKPSYDPLFPELSESFDSPSLILKTTVLTSTEYETKTSVQTKNKTYTLVVTRVNGDEQVVTSSHEVLPQTKTVIVTEPVLRYTTLTLLDLDLQDTMPFVPNSDILQNDTEEVRALDEARYNLATRVMSNGVEVIVAGDKSTLPGEPDVSRILPSSIYKPTTLKPSTLTEHMMMLQPSEVDSMPTSTYPNQFVTKTCLTTFTYLTTYVEDGSTITSSHQQVVSNIATEERNTGKILPTPTMGITLTQHPNLSVGIFPTTYTYLSTIIENDHPVIMQSKHTVTNTVTAPDDYLSLLQPQEKASAVKETNTYYSTVTLKGTLEAEDQSSPPSTVETEEILTQVIITESVPPKATSVMTSYIALDVDDPPKNEKVTTDVVKSYIVTYTYFNTIIEGGTSYVQTNISTSTDVMTEKLYLHPKRTSTKAAASKDVKKKHKFETDFEILATKTYLSTFATTTTLLDQSGGKQSKVVTSRSRVVENIVTETIEPSLLDKKYLSSLRKEIKESETLIKIATINGEKLEITVVAKEKIQPTSVLPILQTEDTVGLNNVFPSERVTTFTEKIESSSPNIITGSTIVFVDEDDDPFKLVASEPTPVLIPSKIKLTTLKNNLNSLLSSEIVGKPSKNSKRHTIKETITPSKPAGSGSSKINHENTNTQSHKNKVDKKKPGKIGSTSGGQVSDLLGLGSININRLTPVLNVMADLIQNNLKASKRNDSVVTANLKKDEMLIQPKTPAKPSIFSEQRPPIYIPVGGFTDIELAESQNIANFKIKEKFTNESPLINGGIPISPGEIITANSDVIVGRPGLVGPRIPAIPIRGSNEVPIGMKPPPIAEQYEESKPVPIKHLVRHPENPVHPIIHVPNKHDYVGPPPPISIEVPSKPKIPKAPPKQKPNLIIKDDYVGPPPPLVKFKESNDYIPLERDQFYQVNEQVLVENHQDLVPNESLQSTIIFGTPTDLQPSKVDLVFKKPSLINNQPLGLPEVVERSTGQPLLVNIQPSQTALVNIPHNRTTALIYGGSTEPHKSGQYFDDPSPYVEPEFSGIDHTFFNGVPKISSVYNDHKTTEKLENNQKQVSGVIKVDPNPIYTKNKEIKPSKTGEFINNVYFDSNLNNKNIQINAAPISFGAIQKDNDFDGYIIKHDLTKATGNNFEKYNQVKFPDDFDRRPTSGDAGAKPQKVYYYQEENKQQFNEHNFHYNADNKKKNTVYVGSNNEIGQYNNNQPQNNNILLQNNNILAQNNMMQQHSNVLYQNNVQPQKNILQQNNLLVQNNILPQKHNLAPNNVMVHKNVLPQSDILLNDNIFSQNNAGHKNNVYLQHSNNNGQLQNSNTPSKSNNVHLQNSNVLLQIPHNNIQAHNNVHSLNNVQSFNIAELPNYNQNNNVIEYSTIKLHSNAQIPNKIHPPNNEQSSNNVILENNMHSHNNLESHHHILTYSDTPSHMIQTHNVLPHNVKLHNVQFHHVQPHNVQSHNPQKHNVQLHNPQKHDIQSHNPQIYNDQAHNSQTHNVQSHSSQMHAVQSHNPQKHNVQSHNSQLHHVQSHIVPSHGTEFHNIQLHNIQSNSNRPHDHVQSDVATHNNVLQFNKLLSQDNVHTTNNHPHSEKSNVYPHNDNLRPNLHNDNTEHHVPQQKKNVHQQGSSAQQQGNNAQRPESNIYSLSSGYSPNNNGNAQANVPSQTNNNGLNVQNNIYSQNKNVHSQTNSVGQQNKNVQQANNIQQHHHEIKYNNQGISHQGINDQQINNQPTTYLNNFKNQPITYFSNNNHQQNKHQINGNDLSNTKQNQQNTFSSGNKQKTDETDGNNYGVNTNLQYGMENNQMQSTNQKPNNAVLFDNQHESVNYENQKVEANTNDNKRDKIQHNSYKTGNQNDQKEQITNQHQSDQNQVNGEHQNNHMIDIMQEMNQSGQNEDQIVNYNLQHPNIDLFRPPLKQKDHPNRNRPQIILKRPRPLRPKYRPRPNVPNFMTPPSISAQNMFNKNVFNPFTGNSPSIVSTSTPMSIPIKTTMKPNKNPYVFNFVDSNKDSQHNGDVNEAGEVIQESNLQPFKVGEIPIDILKIKRFTSTTAKPFNITNKLVVRPENQQNNQVVFHDLDEDGLYTKPGSGEVFIRTNLSITHQNENDKPKTPIGFGIFLQQSTTPPRVITTKRISTTTMTPVTTRRYNNDHDQSLKFVTSLPIDSKISTHRPLIEVNPIEINNLGTQTEIPFDPKYTQNNEITKSTLPPVVTEKTTTATKLEDLQEYTFDKVREKHKNLTDNDLQVMKPPPVKELNTEMKPPNVNIDYKVETTIKPLEIDINAILVPKPSEEMVPPPITTEEVVGMTPPPITTHRPVYKFKLTTPKPYYETTTKKIRRPFTGRPFITKVTRVPVYNWQPNVVLVKNASEEAVRVTEKTVDGWSFEKIVEKPLASTERGLIIFVDNRTAPEVFTVKNVEGSTFRTSTTTVSSVAKVTINNTTDISLDISTKEDIVIKTDGTTVKTERINDLRSNTSIIVNNTHANNKENVKNATIAPDKIVILPTIARPQKVPPMEILTSKVEIVGSISQVTQMSTPSVSNPTKSLESTPILTTPNKPSKTSVINTSPTTMTEITHYGTYRPKETTRRPQKTVINKIISIRPVSTKYITHTTTHTITSTVIVTETRVVETSGGPPSTVTTLVTKTEMITKVDTVMEMTTLYEPTSVIETITKTVQLPHSLYPPGVNYGQVKPTKSQSTQTTYSSTVHSDPDQTDDDDEEDGDNDDFIITENDDVITNENPHHQDENDSILIVVNNKNKGSVIRDEETVSRDEMLETNDVDKILLGGISIPNLPSFEVPNQSKCNPECRAAKNELCQRIDGLMRCVCRPGFARMFPDHPCKPTYTYTMSINLERYGKEKLHYKGTLANHNGTDYLRLSSITQEGLHRMVMQSDLRDIYHGVSINGFGGDSNDALNNNFNLQLSDNTEENRLKETFKRYLRNNNYSLGGTELYASKENLEKLQAEDFNECSNRAYHDCSEYAHCFNLRGTYTCSCKEGYSDLSENILYPGRICSAEIIGCDRCNYHGTCYDRGDDRIICECFQWYAGERCQVNLKVLLIGLVTLGAILLMLLLICVILTCFKRKPKNNHAAAGMSFLPQRVQQNRQRRSTLDRRAMIHDTSSESGQSDKDTLPYIPKKPLNNPANDSKPGHQKLKGALKKPKINIDEDIVPIDQKDRSLTVMIPRAKYHPAPPNSNPHISMSTFDSGGGNSNNVGKKRRASAASSNEAKLLSYLDAGPAPDKNLSSNARKFSTAHSESYIEEKQISRKASGALISAGFEVSATVVGNNMGTLGTIATTCGTEADRSENATLIQKISADLLSNTTGTRSQFNTLRNGFTDDIDDPMSNWMDTRITTVSEARSYDETTIQPPMKSFRHDYDSKPSSQHPNDEANTMAERDLGSTFLLPHTHLYKPGGGSDISGFESL